MAHASIEQVAQALNVTTRRVQQLAQLEQNPLPRIRRGEYNLGACMMWYIRHLQTALRGKATGDDSTGSISSLMAERTKLAAMNRERGEMAMLKARGEVVLISIVREQIQSAIAFHNQAYSALAKRVGADEATQDKIEEEIKLIHHQFADQLGTLVSHGRRVADSRANAKAEAQANAGPVGGSGASPSAGNAGTRTVAK